MARLIAALLLLLAGAAACVSASPPAGPNFYVMRHLQKAEGNDPALSAEGAANAQRLVGLFKADPPRAIFASTTRRASETAAPLAAALGLRVRPYDPRDNAGLVEAVMREKGSVLVIGHSNTVPEIIRLLGGAAPAPLQDSDYGDIWRIDAKSRAVTKIRAGRD